MKKVFFFDVDGTLLPHGQMSVSVKTKYAITELQRLGHEVFLATGKSMEQAKAVSDDLAIENFVVINGQVIARNNEIIFEEGFTPEVINEWVAKAKTNGATIAFIGAKQSCLIEGENYKEAIEFFESVASTVPCSVEEFGFDFTVSEMLLVDDLGKYEFDAKVSKIVPWVEFGGDILPPAASKGRAITYFKENIVDGEVETYGFGDSQNDLEMFEVVDHPVVMGNAEDDIKTYGEVTTSASEDGIYNYLVEEKIITEME